MLLNHIALIVSTEEGVEFYKNLGFVEEKREIREICHDELIILKNDGIVLEIYKDATHPKRISNPEAYGLRHLCFTVDKLDGDYKSDKSGKKFKFIYDPDGQPIELREREN